MQIAFDCADPAALADFWASVLPGYALQAPPPGFGSWPEALTAWGVPEELHHSKSAIEGPGPRLFFQQVPEAKTAKNRVHLDLGSGGGPAVPLEEQRSRVAAEVQRLQGLGASLVEQCEEMGVVWAVMTDPEGNEFCA